MLPSPPLYDWNHFLTVVHVSFQWHLHDGCHTFLESIIIFWWVKHILDKPQVLAVKAETHSL